MSLKAQHEFTDVEPDLDSYWRGIVLFGANVASYKFALAKSLLEFTDTQQETVSLDELAEPFSRHLCQHLREADKQGTSSSSRFLDACRAHLRADLEHDELISQTARLGFANVIDAFHVVGGQEVGLRFFEDERQSSTRGIRLTDDLMNLAQRFPRSDLEAETESRWRLVETAWELNLPRHMLSIGYDVEDEVLLTPELTTRRQITPAREALNGYQRGACFYCFDSISIDPTSLRLAEVDHFFPHKLKTTAIGQRLNLDGVWNLVLACRRCNGSGEKGARLPDVGYLKRLHRRNEWLIASHDPLRETLMLQTGRTSEKRFETLDSTYKWVRESGAGLVPWHTEIRGLPIF